MHHNTFDLVQLGEEEWECKSHNFPECVAKGKTPDEAREVVNRQIIWIADNKPAYAKQNLKYRLDNKLLCMCGYPLDEPPLAFYSGKEIQGLED